MKIKTGYEKGMDGTCLCIEIPESYKEDYKLRMIQENEINGLLELSSYMIDKKSKYSYTITGMVSMTDRYEQQMLQLGDIFQILDDLLEAMRSMKKYMLDPESLLLYPELIFYDEVHWKFCCLPQRKKDLTESFHILSEYFIKKTDLRDTTAIMFTFELHKSTFYKHFELETILNKYRDQNQQEEIEETEGEVSYYTEEQIYTLEEDTPTLGKDIKEVKEEKKYVTSWQKTLGKIKKNCKEFLMETNGQDEEELL